MTDLFKKTIIRPLLFLGIIILTVTLTVWFQENHTHSLSIFHPAEAITIIDTSNTRIQQWKHYYDVIPEAVDTHFRNFYYPTIYQMFIDSGFIPAKAGIYSEIPTIESGWKTLAKNSESTASGLWQFLYGTGKIYGLDHQERHDPLLATRAAIMHIKDLDSLYHGDYVRVLFAYALGMGGLNFYMQQSYTKNPWMAEFPTEAYNFVPKVLGAHLHFEQKE